MALIDEDPQSTPSRAAAIQLAAGAASAIAATAFLCPALGAAGIGAALDGARNAPRLRIAFALVAFGSLAAIASSFVVAHQPSGWAMAGFGAFGLLAGAAALLASLPRGPVAGRASRAGYTLLAGAGGLYLISPGAWVCIAGAGAIATAFACERFSARRAQVRRAPERRLRAPT